MNGQKDWKKQRLFRQVLAKNLQKLFHRKLRQPPYRGPLDSIAILVQEKFGDAILLTPLLKNLKISFPDTEIHLFTFSKAVFGFFSTDTNVTVVHYAKGKPVHLFRLINGKKFDLLFNTKDHPSTSFLLMSFLIRSRRKVGIASEYHEGLFDYLIDRDFHSHIVLKNCGLFEILGKAVPKNSCRPYLPQMPVSPGLRKFLELIPPRHYCGINISAGRPTRYWTEENWKSLTESFFNTQFIVLSSPKDVEQKKRLEESCANIISSPETANLYEASLIAARLKLLVTPDTAMVHVASCSNTPIIGLYGKAPQDQSRFSPFMIDFRMVVSSTALVCDIDFEEVTSAFREIHDQVSGKNSLRHLSQHPLHCGKSTKK